MDLNFIHKYPLVRILIPLLGGIIFADTYDSSPVSIGLFIAVELLLFIILLVLHLKNKSFRLRWLFGVALALLLFLMGVVRTQAELPATLTSESSAPQLATVISSGELKNGRYHYLVQLHDSLECKIILYLPIDSLNIPLFQLGDLIAFKGKLERPSLPLFSSDFDYSRYLKHKSIAGTCFAEVGSAKKLSTLENTFKGWLYRQRQNIRERYISLGLEGDQLALVSALTLGLKDDFSGDLKGAYASAGVSHVLALSGLHIGLLFLILSLFFKLVAHWFGLKDSLALILAVLLLWLFALFVGGSPSVVRSVLLYTLLGLSTLSSRRRVSLNSLAFVAFVMLLFNPFWLFDLGFILSFSAVLAILMFYPLIYPLFKPRYLLGRYLWGLIVVSLGAQLGTMPWIIYNFESFPLYFLLANILIIPMITILLYFLVIYVTTLWVPYLSEFLTSLIRWLTTLINDIVIFVGDLPYAKLSDICLYPVELGLLFMVILAFYLLLKFTAARYVILFLTSLLLLIGVHSVEYYLHYPEKSLKLIRNGKNYYIECVEAGGKLSLIIPQTSAQMSQLVANNHRRWLLNHYQTPKVIDRATTLEAFVYQDGLLFFDEVSVMLGSESVKQNELKASANRFEVDYLILDKNSYNKLAVLLDNYKFSTILAVFNPSVDQKKLLMSICQANNMDYIFLDRKAYVEFLP